MKKFISSTVAAVLLSASVLSGISSIAANTTSFELTKFSKNKNGSYGYSKENVFYFKSSDEKVLIPNEYKPVKKEFRGAWIATINNLNVPITSNEEDFKQNYNKTLDELTQYNMNAVIFQVRPLLDSFYPSTLVPWSQFLVGDKINDVTIGTQGVGPKWDPLEWMIEATHAKGMEYHAWFNPYRVTFKKYSDLLPEVPKDELQKMSKKEIIQLLNSNKVLADNNFAVKNPDLVLVFQEKFFLNPGEKKVIEFVKNSIEEVINNYDVDAIHMDDYFYPYRVGTDYFGSTEDRSTFQRFGIENGYKDNAQGLDAWRRDNVTKLVKELDELITKKNFKDKTAVKFGISPFGIWEHKEVNPKGSNTPTDSSSSYSRQIYADTKLWIEKGYVDYVVPQIYWSFDQSAAPYGELARWWGNAVSGTNVELYIGHPNYKHVQNGGWEAAWMNPEEIINQIKFNQSIKEIHGSVMFSYNDLIKSDIDTLKDAEKPKNEVKNKSIDLIKELYLQNPTLVPEFKGFRFVPINSVKQATLTAENKIVWENVTTQQTGYNVIYAQQTKDFSTPANLVANPANIVAKVWVNGKKNEPLSFEIKDQQSQNQYVYAVTFVNRANIESKPVVAVAK